MGEDKHRPSDRGNVVVGVIALALLAYVVHVPMGDWLLAGVLLFIVAD